MKKLIMVAVLTVAISGCTTAEPEPEPEYCAEVREIRSELVDSLGPLRLAQDNFASLEDTDSRSIDDEESLDVLASLESSLETLLAVNALVLRSESLFDQYGLEELRDRVFNIDVGIVEGVAVLIGGLDEGFPDCSS